MLKKIGFPFGRVSGPQGYQSTGLGGANVISSASPRDFMAFDPDANRLIWYYALPDGVTDTGGYETVDFPGGLYAVAVSRDEDDQDGERVYQEVREWVEKSDCFALDERPGRYTLFHVITSDAAYQVMGYRQLDLYIPLRVTGA